MKAKFIKDITVTDPDSNLPVEVSVYKEEAGGMFGVDSSYLEQDVDDVHSPFGNGVLELEDDDDEFPHTRAMFENQPDQINSRKQ